MSRPRFICMALALLFVSGAAAGLASAGNAPPCGPRGGGDLLGIVTDRGSVPVAGAEVEIRSASAGVARRLRTDTAGRYQAPALPPAIDYVVTISAPGTAYATVVQDRVVVRDRSRTTESFRMFDAIVEEVTIRVDGQGRLVDLAEVGQRTFLDGDFIRGLPGICGLP